MTPEGKVKDGVKRYLKSVGAHYDMPVQTGYGKRMLDFIVCYKGLYLSIETKAPGKKATPIQQYIICEILEAGGLAIVANSVEDVKLAIEILDNRKG